MSSFIFHEPTSIFPVVVAVDVVVDVYSFGCSLINLLFWDKLQSIMSGFIFHEPTSTFPVFRCFSGIGVVVVVVVVVVVETVFVVFSQKLLRFLLFEHLIFFTSFCCSWHTFLFFLSF